jgi:hypothetical protein
MWEWLLAVLASVSADQTQIDLEAPRASAAVLAAYSTTAQEKAPQPQPEPPKPGCCTDCGGKGYITHGDGHRTPCPCPATCKCKAPTGAALTPAAPARPAGGR